MVCEGRGMQVLSKQLCSVRIVRHSGYRDRWRRYRIYANGAEMGTIARDSILDIKVPCGQVTIEARIDWGRSLPLTIEAMPNRNVEIEVFNNPKHVLAL